MSIINQIYYFKRAKNDFQSQQKNINRDLLHSCKSNFYIPKNFLYTKFKTSSTYNTK